MARFNGRAPIVGEKPLSSRNSSAEASHSTAHSRWRSPLRWRTCDSSFVTMLRLGSRGGGRNEVGGGRGERAGDVCHEAGARVLPDRAAEIRRQDDDAVAEVNGVPLRIGEPAIVE